MINFKYVRWKNFLSTGNNFTEIQLDKHPTTLIIGENGAGKCTILDALCFGLFGKPFRNISKMQMVNSINNSSTVVEVEFKIGTVEYKILRSIKPNKFEISKIFSDSPDKAAIIAPTIITEEMALVTDIRGVCREGVTLHTT